MEGQTQDAKGGEEHLAGNQGQLTNRLDVKRLQAAADHMADPGQVFDRQVGEESALVVGQDFGHASRLAQLARHTCHEFARADANGDRHGGLGEDGLLELDRYFKGRTQKAPAAGQVDEEIVDGSDLHPGRDLQQNACDVAALGVGGLGVPG